MVLLWSLQKVNNLLNFPLALMKTSNVCELDVDLLDDLELLWLLTSALSAHLTVLGCPYDGPDDEDDEQHIQEVVDAVEEDFDAGASDVRILNVSILDNEIEDFIEGKDLAGVGLVIDDSSDFLPADFLVAEVFLLHKGNLLERFHLQQLHKRLRS